MSQKFILSAIVASATIASPLITGKILKPDGNPIAGVIVQLKSTLETDTTDAAGIYALGKESSSSNITPIIGKNIVISQKNDLIRLSLGQELTIRAELFDATGSLLQTLFDGTSQRLEFKLPKASGVQYLKLKLGNQNLTYAISNGVLSQHQIQVKSAVQALGLPLGDTLVLSKISGVIFQEAIPAGKDTIPNLILGHKSISGTYQGADTLGIVTMSNSSQGLKDSTQTKTHQYLFDVWYKWPSGKFYNANENWNAYLTIGGRTSPIFSFKESEELITGPSLSAPISSTPSSSSTVSSSSSLNSATSLK